jgi:hypothetical protein
MGSVEVLEVLKNHKTEWLTIHEILEEIDSDFGYCSISNTLKRLTMHDEIKRKKGDYANNCYMYKYKR